VTQHPITPPPELVHQWFREGNHLFPQIAAKAAQWGADQAKADIERKLQEAADQELEACCEWMSEYVPYLPESEDKLRAARRPKPPSLKESALNALEHILRHSQTDHGANTIRRALEALDD